jgi:hypothetical protein
VGCGKRMYSCGWKCSIAEYGARGLLRSLSACRRRRTVSSLAWPTRLSSGATFSGGGGGSSMLHLHVALRTPFAFIVVDKYSVPPKVSMTRTPYRSGFKVICCRFGPSFQTEPYPSHSASVCPAMSECGNAGESLQCDWYKYYAIIPSVPLTNTPY